MISHTFPRLFASSVVFAAPVALVAQATAQTPLQLQKGDNIAIVGSGLADRQQHSAWLEALIHRAYPDLDLTVRNLGFAADEIDVQIRSDDVPKLEWFLSMKTGESKPPGSKSAYRAGTDFGANVILAYWGFNESFKGTEGVDKFKTVLGAWIDAQKNADYSGKGAPRLVLFSPIAQENLKDPNFGDGKENNENLAIYTKAMSDVAKEKGILFIDLYHASLDLYGDAKSPLTINGIHLTEEGDKALAPVQFKALFGKDAPASSDPQVERIREAVLDKNKEWHHRYRTVDQYNIFGDRSRISYEGMTNARILNQELAQRDVKTANRDKVVWAIAKGGNLVAKDDNLPPVESVPPNRKEKVPYTDPEETIKYLKTPAGIKIELMASEKDYPELVNPVQMNFDTKGRLWIAAWKNYPETSPTTKVFDKLLVIDLDPKTGKAVKMTTFADGLNCPTGFQFYKDGVLVMQSPDLWYLRDTDGDGKADTKERVLHGLDAADSHHETNSMCLEPGGAVYLSDGIFHRSSVETFDGPVRNIDGAIYRYEPNTGKFSRHAPYPLLNPHGRVFDYWGNDLITDATGNDNYFGPAMSGHLDTGSHPPMEKFWDRPSRPSPGTAILSSRHFPDDWQGLFLNTNVISIQGIFRARLTEEGSGLKGETLEHLIAADIAKNPNFRPSGITVAPDGSLYFMDWSQMLIGHLQHHLRDPNRDHQHGRLYRITYEGRPLLEPKKIYGEPIPALLSLLKEPENDVRLRAKIELGKHQPGKVADATVAWVKTLDQKDPAYEHHLLEALWVHQWHNVVNMPLLKRVLASPEHRARAQGVRVLGYWRDRVPEALDLLTKAANDKQPRVRLEAVRVASFFRETAAASLALEALKQPMDYHLDYCFQQTMKQLKPWWQNAIAEGKEIAVDNPAGLKFLLSSVPTAELAKLPKTTATLTAVLTRDDASSTQRDASLAELSDLKKVLPAQALVSLIAATGDDGAASRTLGKMLLMQNAAALKSIRPALANLAAGQIGNQTSSTAAAALMVADGSLDSAWATAQESPHAMGEFLSAVKEIPDPRLRATGSLRVAKLLSALPPRIESAMKGSQSVSGRYVRISLPRKGTLSLAEVQISSGGKNIAESKTARQHSTAHGGAAGRAVDGKTGGIYFEGSVTHTNENTDHPWWEVDLGTSQPIDSVTIWNRTDAPHGTRLDGFELTVINESRAETFRKPANPAPEESATIRLENDLAGDLRREVIRTLPFLDESEGTFRILAKLIGSNDQPSTAAQAIAEVPEKNWDKDSAASAVDGLVRWARTVPAAKRTEADYTKTMSVANRLISMLSPDQAAAANGALANLDVPVFTIKTVPEQLRYDIDRLVVEAGKPFEIRFENPDGMPHNIVFVMPGTMQEVALAVQTQAPDKLDGKGRAYLPENDSRVIDASKLLEAGESETLKLTAPEEEGTYQYVCTFPGHWAIMKGDLIVTKDIKAYRAANPDR